MQQIPSARASLGRYLSREISLCRTAHRNTNCRRYTVAITREVSESLADGLTMDHAHDSDNLVSVGHAKNQKKNYVNTLRSILPTVSLPPLQNHPDCVFVEDTAVTIGKVAVINRIGHTSRQGEVDDMKVTFQQFGLDITDMRHISSDATCDGGDVMYPGGDYLFVGQSNRTNERGIQVLRDTFETKLGIQVIDVPNVTDDALHLKSVVTHLDTNTILAPTGPLGDDILKAMKASDRGFEYIVRLPDLPSCNVVSVNGHILAPATQCQETRDILKKETTLRNLQLHYVDMSEFAKIDGALTCCSILLDI